MKISLKVNGSAQSVEVEPDMPLLWVLRDVLGMMGTKYGCGIARCGACTVLVNGRAGRSCVMPVSAIKSAEITTIEGLSQNQMHTVQAAWIETQVPQCGYCQTGQIMSAVAILSQIPDPSDDDIDAGMAGNICRCGTYPRIREAIHRASKMMHKG